MKLSFVIPARNEEKYIGQCLASVVRESKRCGRDIEIVVVDNASADRTKEIALSFPGVKVVDEPVKGLPQARNSGFLASSGDLIANVDSDSKIPPGWIETVYKSFEQDPKLVALSGPYIYYDFSKFKNLLVRIYYYPGYFFHLINHYILGKAAMLQGGNFILKRDALERIGGYNLDIKFYGEDTDIARRIQSEGRVKFTFDLPMSTSARRLKKEGLVMVGLRYAANHFWTIFFKKPLSKDYTDIRE